VTLRDKNALQFGATSVTSLAVAAGGGVTQIGSLATPGTDTFDAGASNDVTLSNGLNSFGTVKVPHANDLLVTDGDGGGLTLGTSSVVDMTVHAAGDITDEPGASVSAANSFMDAPGHDVTLDGADDFSTFIAHAHDETVNDVNGIGLGGSRPSPAT